MKKKVEMEAGVRYKGYGWRNEFGEFMFEPEKKGSREGFTKLIRSTENYTISETKNCVVVHLRLDKGTRMELLQGYLKQSNNIFNDLKEYEI